LTSTDIDGTANAFTAVSTATTTTGGFGTYTMTAAGVWGYSLNNSNTTVQALATGATLTDTFTVTAADGTPRVITVTITGTNDVAVISGTATGAVTEASGVANATPGTPTATGTLTSTDVDGTANAFTAVGTATTTIGGFGTYTMTASGVWSYNLNNSNTTVQALAAGATLTDTFTVTAADGTPRVITVTITGANDAAVISGAATGAVTEAGGVANGTAGIASATGTLTSTDVDGTANAFTAVTTATATTGGFGTYTMTAAGVWSYNLNNSNTTVQALATGATLTDTFTVTAADGTPRVITVTITGTNDAAVISGTATGAVTEAGGAANATPGTPNATGTLTSTDVDGTANAFTAVTTATATTGGFGTYTMTSAGVWAYNLNNSNTTVQALATGATLTDTFTVTAADGTPRVISGTVIGAVTEAGGVANATLGAPTATGTMTATDVDGTPNTFIGVSPGTVTTGGYGTYSMTISGVWNYMLNDNNATVQALAAGATLNDTFTVTAADGTPRVITVTITGTNDAAVISGTATGAVTEAGGVANATPGTPTATGTLTSTDVDGTANAFTAVSTATASVGGYGTYTMTSAGVWVYTLNNNNATVQALSGTQKLTDSFTVTAADGTPRVITVTVSASNDAPVVALAIPDQMAVLGTSFSYTVPAGSFTDIDSALTYTATRGDGTALPSWLTFNAATRTFSGAPNSTVDFNVTVTASDGTASISDTFLLSVAPVVNTVAISSATGIQNTFLNAGDTVTATIGFGEVVNVTGTPQLTLNIGGVLVNANYVSGSGTSNLAFSYTILPGQTDGNGISIGGNAVSLNGGTIKDAVGNNATLNFAALADNTSYKVDTTAPAVGTLTLTDTGSSPTDGITQNGTVTVGALDAGATWEYSTNGGSTWLAGSGTSFVLPAGIYAAGTVQMRQTDLAGNVQTGALIAKNAAVITVDQIAPILVDSNPGDGGYLLTMSNDLVLNFSESVAKGTGLIQLER
jgi:VCBS repeat-containing protein